RGRDQAALLLSDNALRSVRGGVAIADLRSPGRPIIYYNAAMSAILGDQPGRFPRYGTSVGLMSGVGDGASLLRSLAAGAGSQPASSPTVRRALRRGDEIVWVDVALTWVSVSGGAPSHVVIAFNDVSEQVAAEQELLRSLEEVAQLHDEQSRFCEILAHHLQEPVRRVVAQAQLLRRAHAGLNAEADQALRELENSGRRLRALLRDVELYMSAGVLTPSHGVASADAALGAALHRLRRPLEESGAQLLRNPLPMVGMAQAPLTEVLFALIDNALTHSAPDRPPVISIDATPRGSEWVICVEDNGAGIERAYFERIFKVFERLKPAAGDEPNAASAGTGIGLALARKLVERAGGRIWLESEPGLGSRFFVALPAADAPRPTPSAPVSSAC
ncbi:MAG TPA: ATP-binding protein, partial [Azospirillaceae bacterium]|nr:ATP-binding protein [Azospirillaceae bacterium]